MRQPASAKAFRGHHVDTRPHQVGCEFRQSILVPFCPAIFHDEVSTLDIPEVVEPLAERTFSRLAGVGDEPEARKPIRHLPRLLRLDDEQGHDENRTRGSKKRAPVIIRSSGSIEPPGLAKTCLLSQEPRNVSLDLTPRVRCPREGSYVSESHRDFQPR